MKVNGIDVDYSKSNLPEEKIEEFCNKATADILYIEDILSTKISRKLKHILILPSLVEDRERLVRIAFDSRPGYIDAKTIEGEAAAYHEYIPMIGGSVIKLYDNMMDPFRERNLVHELGHLFYETILKDYEIEMVRRVFEDKHDNLVERIVSGEDPEYASKSILTRYAFFPNKVLPKTGKKSCIKGFVGKVSEVYIYNNKEIFKRMAYEATILPLLKLMGKNPRHKKPIIIYQFHSQENAEHEFFAEMFAEYFFRKSELESNGMLDFTEDIIKRRKQAAYFPHRKL